MTFRRNVSGPHFKLCLMLCAMSVSGVALAQGETGAGTGSSATSTDEAAADAPKAELSATAEATALTEEKPAAKVEQSASAAAPAASTPQAGAAEATHTPEAAQAADEAPPVSVEILPGSGYPEPKIRGIVGGSLWLVMPGYQFPYMPAKDGKPGVRLAFSGNVWNDTSYANIKSGTPEIADSRKRWKNQGRAVLRATPVYNWKDGWFVQGQVEVVGKSDQTTTGGSPMGFTDDLWVRAGKWNVFDVTAGRFQGWEVYHYGMGLDWETFERRGAEVENSKAPPQIYGLDTYWDRADVGQGSYAAHVYFTDYLRLEVLGRIGSVGVANVRGVRPVGVLDLGFFKLKAGLEYGTTSATAETSKAHSKTTGVGGTAQFILNPHIEGGFNAGLRYVDDWTKDGLPNPPGSTTMKSFGGFINGRPYGDLILGVGLNQTLSENLEVNGINGSPNFGLSDYATHTQGFFAIQYSFWNKLFFKFVGAYASYHYEDRVQEPAHPYTHSMTSGRLRMMYLF